MFRHACMYVRGKAVKRKVGPYLWWWYLTGAIFETGAYGVPSKSQKSFICGGVRQTITLKSPGKGAPPSTPSWGLQ